MFDSSAPSGTQQSNNRGFPSTSVLPDPSRLTTTKPSLWDEPKPLATSTDSKTLADTKVKVEERDVVLDHHRHYATSASRTTPYAPALNPSLSSVSSSAPSILSTPSAATNSSSATQNGSASSLTREIWDVRREIAALAARETVLEEHLKRLGSRPAPEPSATKPAFGGSKTAWLAPSDVISKLRAQLRTEYEARKAAEHALRDERQQRELAAAAVANIHRECRAPFVVPALVDAFVEISRITGDVLAGL
ncbi:hypothetical protein EVJ58_g8629 [Rhodofomes roseus]|uniref:Uncharacterized protein n=1 Tax=Rhodofomes roseus TaxID=34475 RepID=A0A4Y9Y0B9_9APHY|nr:hypothetical protein EVJ58_g8629 [Rhodofomes roseus]